MSRGASTFRVFWSVVLPMAEPALITVTILSFQKWWNELPHFLVAARDRDLYTLVARQSRLRRAVAPSGSTCHVGTCRP